jgi:hypothetical protein
MRRLLVSLALTALVFGSACGCGDRSQSAKRAGDSVTPAAESAEAASAAESQIQAGLPDDIPIPDGLRATSVSSEEPGSLVALFTGDLEPDQVARVFADGLKKQGWAIDQSGRPGGELGVFARKQQRIASVVVTRLAGKLHVELGVWAPKE